MQIWHYHNATGELLGSSLADPNPMEAGEWLLPAFSTPVAPPERQDGHAVVFAGSSWANVPDHRDEVWWQADAEFNTEPVVIDRIGDPAAFEPPLTNVEPPAPPVVEPPIAVSPRQIRQVELARPARGRRGVGAGRRSGHEGQLAVRDRVRPQ